MPPVKSKKSETFASNNGLKSRLASSIMGRLNNSENTLPGLENKPRLRLLEVTSRNDSSKFQAKRKTIFSPQGPVTKKRTAFSDVTNAIQRLPFPLGNLTNKPEKLVKDKKIVSSSIRKVASKKQPPAILEDVTEDAENATLYMSALEDIQDPFLQTQSQPEVEASSRACEEISTKQRRRSEPSTVTALLQAVEATSSVCDYVSADESQLTELVSAISVTSNSSVVCPSQAWHLKSPDSPPPGVKNFDRDIAGDANSVPDYAPYIFSYLQSREPVYQVRADFLSQHHLLNNDIRALCIDWMVEVQETLELNHETLYLGVKNMDLFLSRPQLTVKKYSTPPLPIKPSRLRLLAAASLLLAAQYDERLPPPADDWLQMCDQDYTVAELATMQQQLFCALDFDLGAPLSYRFLRRFARACSIDMDLLTLGRYILESSLLHSQFSSESDSKLAAAGLWLAMCMQAKLATQEDRFALWSPALEHYSSYTVSQIHDIAKRLNDWLRTLPTKYLKTVHSKYSHRVFRKVALIPTLEEL